MTSRQPTRERTRGSDEARTAKDFLTLSQRVLLSASLGRPSIEFLIDISKAMISFFECNALELWLQEEKTCAQWEATREPMRFCRLGDVSRDVVESLIRRGADWTNDAGEGNAFDLVHGVRSMARFPLTCDDRSVGLIILKSERSDFFREAEIWLYQHFAQTLAVAVAFQKVHLAQQERLKELTCLHEIAKVAAQTHAGLQEIIQNIVLRLPPAWQYPEITEARIVVEDQSYTTDGFTEGCHQQRADIVADGKRLGVVEVVYKEDKPEIDEGPFLAEERKLINTVAQEVASIVQRKTAEEERVKLNEQILHADRLATIGQLAASVAHELNEPLGGILGFSQLARKHPNLPPQVSQDIAKIENASLHAREVIRKLMQFARQTSPTKERVNLNHLVENGLYFFEARCAKMGIELIRNLQPDLPEIVVDPTQVHQILINLVVNAKQAMPEGGSLTVETTCHEGRVSIIVTDTGLGMSKEVKERMFEPFFTTKEGEGTGLGLSVVRRIVVSHGGDVEARSRPGRGTRITVHLPIDAPSDATKGA
jgi:signal transduction histidine kinase